MEQQQQQQMEEEEGEELRMERLEVSEREAVGCVLFVPWQSKRTTLPHSKRVE
jgi:hypothetical protein